MRAKEFLTERASSRLYHYTSTRAAAKILRTGEFELTSTVGSDAEAKYAPKGYPYFLSLTRTRLGDYHRFVGASGVLFTINGDWFSSRYPVRPIDYWERAWLHSDGTRSREAEDRVFSKEPSIPATAIEEVHVLLKEQSDAHSYYVRQLLIAAKRQQIPLFFYRDEQAWRLLDQRRSLPLSQIASMLRGSKKPQWGVAAKNYLKPWWELLTKQHSRELSSAAAKILSNIRYYNREGGDLGLSIDLHNARKPEAHDRETALEIIRYMQKNKIANTKDLVKQIAARWTNAA